MRERAPEDAGSAREQEIIRLGEALEELTRTNEGLHAAHRAVLSHGAHELRGPLTVILGWTNILLDPSHPPDEAILAKGLAAIRRAAAAQERLITNLVDARLGSDKPTSEPSPE
jgi:signal transduction histidine kinase